MITRLFICAAAVAALSVPTYAAQRDLGGIEVTAPTDTIRINMAGKDFASVKPEIFWASEVVCRKVSSRDPLWDTYYLGAGRSESRVQCWRETSTNGLDQARHIIAMRRDANSQVAARGEWLVIATR